MKKIFAVLLTLVFAISLAMPVFAQETNEQEAAPQTETTKMKKHHKKASKKAKKEAKKAAKESKSVSESEDAPQQ